jgi:F-type H+-transporting ATPase subunit b
MLDINITAVLIQAGAFVILAFVLGRFVFGPIGAQVEARQKEIVDTLEQAASDRRAMEQSRAEYEKRLAGIEAEAREHIKEAVGKANEEAAAILAEARQDASDQREKAVAEIEQERKKAIAQIRAEMADLAVLAASKVLEREITPKVHRELISDFIGDVGARPS